MEEIRARRKFPSRSRPAPLVSHTAKLPLEGRQGGDLRQGLVIRFARRPFGTVHRTARRETRVTLQTRRLTHKFGAEILGLDLSRPQDDATIAAIWKLWNEQGLVLIRNQHITPEQLIAFSAGFGALDRHPNLAPFRHPQYDEIYMVSTIPSGGKPSPSEKLGRHWHSDLSYTLYPAMGSLFHCQVCPEVGGDTIFASITAAYDDLSDAMKEMIDPLWCEHDYMAISGGRHLSPEVAAQMKKLNPPVAQPLVRTHPVTGRKALYIASRVITHIIGMTPEESRPLIDYLVRHTIDPLYTYRHKWSKHELVMWDNRSLVHSALADFDAGTPRKFFRTTVLGEQSGHLA